MWANWVSNTLTTTGVFAVFRCPPEPHIPDSPYLVPLQAEDAPYKGRAIIVADKPDDLVETVKTLNTQLQKAGEQPIINIVFLSFADLVVQVSVYNTVRAKGQFEIGGVMRGRTGYLLTPDAYRAFRKPSGQPKVALRKLVADVTTLTCPTPVWEIAWQDVEGYAKEMVEQVQVSQQMIPLFTPRRDDDPVLQ